MKLKKPDFNKLKVNFQDQIANLSNGGKPLIWTVVFTFLLMIVVCLAVFFASVQGAERVMVPDVVGKDLETALLEMQVKELYPKIQLKYSDIPGDKGKILEQEPDSGAIVKAYRRINLTVSRGTIVNQIEDYIGMNYDELKMNLQTQFTGQRQLIVLSDPVYEANASEAGTILQQNPPAGTSIVEPIVVDVIVSRGQTYENTRVPRIVGMSIDAIYQIMKSSKITFDFTSHVALENEIIGTITDEQTFETEFVPNYSRVTAEFAFPAKAENNIKYGIYTATLADYPYPISVRLDAIDSNGITTTVVDFSHIGKNLTIPYAVPMGTVLKLYVVGKEINHFTVD